MRAAEAYLAPGRTTLRRAEGPAAAGTPRHAASREGGLGGPQVTSFCGQFPISPNFLELPVPRGHALHSPFAWMGIDVPEGATEIPPAQGRGQQGKANTRDSPLGRQLPGSPCSAWQGRRAQARFLWARPAAGPPTTRGHKEAGRPPRLLQNRTSGALTAERHAAANRHATAGGRGGGRGLFRTRT